jgi:hypothetical protein
MGKLKTIDRNSYLLLLLFFFFIVYNVVSLVNTYAAVLGNIDSPVSTVYHI